MKFKYRGQWRGWDSRWRPEPVTVRIFMPSKFTGGGWAEQ
ncbi:hypothetical protein ES703_06908 [subsurface metagenome]